MLRLNEFDVVTPESEEEAVAALVVGRLVGAVPVRVGLVPGLRHAERAERRARPAPAVGALAQERAAPAAVAKAAAESVGLAFARTDVPNDDPAVMGALARRVRQAHT